MNEEKMRAVVRVSAIATDGRAHLSSVRLRLLRFFVCELRSLRHLRYLNL
jgi:hypothetical protein